MKEMLTLIAKVEKCLAQLDDACKELEEVGLYYSSCDMYCNNNILPPTIYLKRGLNELSVVLDKKIESQPSHYFGSVTVGNIRFAQEKLPVEREDRYE